MTKNRLILMGGYVAGATLFAGSLLYLCMPEFVTATPAKLGAASSCAKAELLGFDPKRVLSDGDVGRAETVCASGRTAHAPFVMTANPKTVAEAAAQRAALAASSAH